MLDLGGASSRGSHRLAAVGTCKILWAYRYWWHIRPKRYSSWALGGTLIHTCYQYFAASLLPAEQRPAWFNEHSLWDALKAQVDDAGVPEPKRSELIEMARSNLDAYTYVYEPRYERMRPLIIEDECRTTVGALDPEGPNRSLDKEVVTCRLDLAYEDLERGGVWLVDYKSKGRSACRSDGTLKNWNSNNEFALDWQVLTNLHIVRQQFEDVRGFYIVRTTRQVPFNFDWNLLTIPSDPYKCAPRVIRELVQMEREVVDELQRGVVPRRSYHQCWGRYGVCDYRPLCMAKPSERLWLLKNEYMQPSEAELAQLRSGLH